jgi:hypothetical protein
MTYVFHTSRINHALNIKYMRRLLSDDIIFIIFITAAVFVIFVITKRLR